MHVPASALSSSRALLESTSIPLLLESEYSGELHKRRTSREISLSVVVSPYEIEMLSTESIALKTLFKQFLYIMNCSHKSRDHNHLNFGFELSHPFHEIPSSFLLMSNDSKSCVVAFVKCQNPKCDLRFIQIYDSR